MGITLFGGDGQFLPRHASHRGFAAVVVGLPCQDLALVAGGLKAEREDFRLFTGGDVLYRQAVLLHRGGGEVKRDVIAASRREVLPGRHPETYPVLVRGKMYLQYLSAPYHGGDAGIGFHLAGKRGLVGQVHCQTGNGLAIHGSKPRVEVGQVHGELTGPRLGLSVALLRLFHMNAHQTLVGADAIHARGVHLEAEHGHHRAESEVPRVAAPCHRGACLDVVVGNGGRTGPVLFDGDCHGYGRRIRGIFPVGIIGIERRVARCHLTGEGGGGGGFGMGSLERGVDGRLAEHADLVVDRPEDAGDTGGGAGLVDLRARTGL